MPSDTPPAAATPKTAASKTALVLRKLDDLFKSREDLFATIAANQLDPKRLFKVTLSAIARSPGLLEATPSSLLDSLMRSAELGLEPTGNLGGAYLVPFKDHGVAKAQLIVGYRGYIALARRSGKVSKIEAQVVHAKDLFRIVKGTSPSIVHEPAFVDDPGPVTGAYAWALLTDGATQFEAMTLGQLEAIRAKSKSAGNKDGPWLNHTEEMYRKTAVRRLVKYLPLSAEAEKAIAEDDEVDFERSTVDVTPPAGPAKSRTEELKDRLKGPAEEPEEVLDDAGSIPTRDELAEPGQDG